MQFWDLVEIDRKVGRQQFILIDFLSKEFISALGQNRAEVLLPYSALLLPQPSLRHVLARVDERINLRFALVELAVLRSVPRRFLMSWDRKFEKNNKTSSKTLTNNSKRKSKDKLSTTILSKS